MIKLLGLGKTRIELAILFTLFSLCTNAKNEYSLVSVPEESGIKFERITEDADDVYLQKMKNSLFFGMGRNRTVAWCTLPAIAVSPDGQRIAYIFKKDNSSNIMVKNANQGGASIQRTFRTQVTGISWSTDGNLCFSEQRDRHNEIH